jgi:hypothetical protein
MLLPSQAPSPLAPPDRSALPTAGGNAALLPLAGCGAACGGRRDNGQGPAGATAIGWPWVRAAR